MADPDRASGIEPPPRPRWVKVFGIVVAVIVVIVVVFAIFGGGQHGPGRHLPGGDGGDRTAPGQYGL